MIAVLGMLIVVHELGHFLAARWQGIHVNRFSIGFGPALWKYQGPETEYALRSVPLGGYVGFPDDDPEMAVDPNDPDLLKNRPILDRVIVISAGVIANLIFAYFLLVVQVGTVGVAEVSYQPGVLVPQVATEASAAAAQAGIKAGDLVLAVNNQPLGVGEAARQSLMDIIQTSPNQPLEFRIQRADQQLDLTVTPRVNAEGKTLIGVQLLPNAQEVTRRSPHHIGEIFTAAATDFERIIRFMAQTLGQMVGNFRETAGQVAGPVGIVAIGANMARTDATSLFQFAAVISVNLAFINILPLPALDGGQLAFLLIEGVRGKPLPHGLQEGVMQTGLVLLLSLGMFLIVRDTANLEWVQRLFQ